MDNLKHIELFVLCANNMVIETGHNLVELTQKAAKHGFFLIYSTVHSSLSKYGFYTHSIELSNPASEMQTTVILTYTVKKHTFAINLPAE